MKVLFCADLANYYLLPISWLKLNTAWHKDILLLKWPLPLPLPLSFMLGYCSFELSVKTHSLLGTLYFVTNTDFLYITIQNTVTEEIKHSKIWLAQLHGQRNLREWQFVHHCSLCHPAKCAHNINPIMPAARTVWILTMGKTWNIWHPEVYFVGHWENQYKWNSYAMMQLPVNVWGTWKEECAAKYLPYKTIKWLSYLPL